MFKKKKKKKGTTTTKKTFKKSKTESRKISEQHLQTTCSYRIFPHHQSDMSRTKNKCSKFLNISVSLSLSHSVSVSLSLCLSVHLSLSVSLSLCLTLSVSVSLLAHSSRRRWLLLARLCGPEPAALDVGRCAVPTLPTRCSGRAITPLGESSAREQR